MRRARAFTLIEVMLAMAIMIALSGSMFGFLWNMLERRDRLLGIAQDSQAATAVLERIETDIFGAIADDAKGAAGIIGKKTSLKILTRGVNLPRQGGLDAAALGDLQGAEYVFDEGAGELRARRWGGQEGAGGSGGAFEVVSDRIERVQFRFFNGRRWAYRFDSSKSKNLPVAIEVAIWFKPASVIKEEEEEARRRALFEQVEGELTEQMIAEEFEGTFEDDLPEIEVIREPDRLRVILVPDGPLAAWREST